MWSFEPHSKKASENLRHSPLWIFPQMGQVGIVAFDLPKEGELVTDLVGFPHPPNPWLLVVEPPWVLDFIILLGCPVEKEPPFFSCFLLLMDYPFLWYCSASWVVHQCIEVFGAKIQKWALDMVAQHLFKFLALLPCRGDNLGAVSTKFDEL